jgi:penicillin-binding protein 2
MNDPKLRPQINRATYENYAPGSIFKPIVGLAALENGLNPDARLCDRIRVRARSYVGRRQIRTLAPPGQYNFRRAIIRSCNTYFITNGLRTGIEKHCPHGRKNFIWASAPACRRGRRRRAFSRRRGGAKPDWRDGDTANICIGQGEMAVTPMQMAVAYSAIANGGKVLWPRLVERIEPQDPASRRSADEFSLPASCAINLGVHPRSFENFARRDAGGNRGPGRHRPRGAPCPVCAFAARPARRRSRTSNQLTGWHYWFASFAPYENPRYAVVVMVNRKTAAPAASSARRLRMTFTRRF